jgi:hypothetical protein
MRIPAFLLVLSLSSATALHCQGPANRGPERAVAAERPVDPVAAAAMSLVLPGAGQVYTRRPLLGGLFFGAAGGALVLGLLSERVTVECLARATEGCPPDQVLSETRERQHLDAALVGVAGVALASAIDAYHAARSRNARVAAARPDADGRPRLRGPGLEAGGSHARLSLLRLTF